MGEEFRGDWIHVYVWLSPFAVHLETITILLIGCTPTQNKKFKTDQKRKVCNFKGYRIIDTMIRSFEMCMETGERVPGWAFRSMASAGAQAP